MATANMNSKFGKLNMTESFENVYPLRMTADKKTEMYVKFAKLMIIFQGPVTDERYKAVNELSTKFKYAGRVVSDDTYRKETARRFSAENTDDFYSYFRNRVKKSCEDGYNLIIIDQSMTNSHQLKYYLYLAQTMQYLILPFPPLVRQLFDDTNCRKTQAGELRHHKKGNSFTHLFCGFFLHDVDSAELRDEANLYVQDCYDIPEFYEYISKITDSEGFAACYNMVTKRQNLAFSAVKIFNSIFDVQKYMSGKTFFDAYGRMTKLFVVGFIISPHMIAARIKLIGKQRELWEMPDEFDEAQQDRQPTVFPSELVRKNKVELPGESVTLIASKCNRTIIYDGNPIESPTEVIHPRTRGKSCHIVLGKVKGAPVKNVDYDVPIALCRERKALQNNAHDHKPYDLDRCLVRRVGKYWYIYLKETLVINGLFASYCSIENS